LRQVENRRARFRTVIALILGGKEYFFEGILSGSIQQTRSGANGFGYDPIFLPNGYSKTLAEMTAQEKNAISHRALALRKTYQFLHKLEKSLHP